MCSDARLERKGIAAALDDELDDHARVLKDTVEQTRDVVQSVVKAIVACFSRGGRLWLCGNGGSAADAQHIAAEFVNRFRFDRTPLAACALTTDTSILTAIANDSSYDDVFARQISAFAKAGDVLGAMSTSGRSANVLRALSTARQLGVITVGFTGSAGIVTMAEHCDFCLAVASRSTARVQEAHEFIWHFIAGEIEAQLFSRAD